MGLRPILGWIINRERMMAYYRENIKRKGYRNVKNSLLTTNPIATARETSESFFDGEP